MAKALRLGYTIGYCTIDSNDNISFQHRFWVAFWKQDLIAFLIYLREPMIFHWLIRLIVLRDALCGITSLQLSRKASSVSALRLNQQHLQFHRIIVCKLVLMAQ